MLRIAEFRISIIWLLLVGATLISWCLGHSVGLQDDRMAGVAIILLSLVKVRFVALDFMELRHAPTGLKLLADGWLVGVGALLIGLFAFPANGG